MSSLDGQLLYALEENRLVVDASTQTQTMLLDDAAAAVPYIPNISTHTLDAPQLQKMILTKKSRTMCAWKDIAETKYANLRDILET